MDEIKESLNEQVDVIIDGGCIQGQCAGGISADSDHGGGSVHISITKLNISLLINEYPENGYVSALSDFLTDSS